MKYSEFKIKNFKGIEEITFNLNKSPDANIYTLVGLNESGKTTILEAINLFNPKDQGLAPLEIPGSVINDYNMLIPISKRDNFDGTISIEVTINLETEDYNKINEFLVKETVFEKVKKVTEMSYYRHYIFKDSIFKTYDRKWDGFSAYLKNDPDKKFISIGNKSYPEVNTKLASFCGNLIPSILYFPNFLFDFPSKIFLETKGEPTAKEKFYLGLIQDVLYSLENNTNVQTHLVDRIKSSDLSSKRSLDRLIQLMGKKITNVVFDGWNKIFKRKIEETRIVISYSENEDGLAYLEFEIEAEDGIYQINERSLGFKWFFIFLLFTQFRRFRKDTPKNILFLFDEPASNLHSSAQKQLLKSFETLTENSKVIYTTHSHHLINPNWLESTYVVKNDGLNLSNPESYNVKKTNISIQSYREFAGTHPHNTAYFQPILDVLEYAPSDLESLPNCAFFEGKNDYYSITYFKEVILESKDVINLAPSTGSGNLDTLISLYIGWGKEFIVILDSDESGMAEKKRYIEKFGILLETRVFTLEDINKKWKDMELEKTFKKDELLSFQKTAYPETTKYNKTHFNRAIQESLINKRTFSFSDETKNNFQNILNFINEKLNKK